MTYWVYVLRCKDGSLYAGLARYLARRMQEHTQKLPACARYTRSRGVESLAALWKTDSRADAARLEALFKTLPKAKKESLVAAPETLYAVFGEKLTGRYEAMIGVTLENIADVER